MDSGPSLVEDWLRRYGLHVDRRLNRRRPLTTGGDKRDQADARRELDDIRHDNLLLPLRAAAPDPNFPSAITLDVHFFLRT
jgi:hypothetical protein